MPARCNATRRASSSRSSRVSHSKRNFNPRATISSASPRQRVAILSEQRIAEDDVRVRVLLTQVFQLADDARDGSLAVAGQDSMWAIGAELRTTATRQDRKSGADWPDDDRPETCLNGFWPTRSQRGKGSASRSSSGALATMPVSRSPANSRAAAPPALR